MLPDILRQKASKSDDHLPHRKRFEHSVALRSEDTSSITSADESDSNCDSSDDMSVRPRPLPRIVRGPRQSNHPQRTEPTAAVAADPYMDSLERRPRGFQLEILERAKEHNVVCFAETGCGKTYIAVMLLRYVVMQQRELFRRQFEDSWSSSGNASRGT